MNYFHLKEMPEGSVTSVTKNKLKSEPSNCALFVTNSCVPHALCHTTLTEFNILDAIHQETFLFISYYILYLLVCFYEIFEE